MDEREITSRLRTSAMLIGKLYPVLLGKHGEIIDGTHRLKVDPNWPSMQVQGVESEEQILLARLVSNVCRRDVSKKEKTEMLRQLARLNLAQGVTLNKLAKVISEKTGMSYRWVMKYIPNEFKARAGLGGPKKFQGPNETTLFFNNVSYPANEFELFSRSRAQIVQLSYYSNTNFATVLLEKEFYLKLAKAAKAVGADPCVIINNGLLWALQKTEKIAKQNHDSNEMLNFAETL
jgi:hypothetical protein